MDSRSRATEKQAMKHEISTALRMTAITLVVTGLLYPLAVTGVASAMFPAQARGSLIRSGGRVVGSALIGQRFDHPAYFQGRPSAAGASGYDAAGSTGSNLGPTSKALRERVVAEIARLKRDNPGAPGAVPIELVTTSGSGLDPDLSPAAARWQIPRVARRRRLDPAKLEALVARRTQPRALGLLGEPRVNVLQLNLELDRLFGPPPAGLSTP